MFLRNLLFVSKLFGAALLLIFLAVMAWAWFPFFLVYMMATYDFEEEGFGAAYPIIVSFCFAAFGYLYAIIYHAEIADALFKLF